MNGSSGSLYGPSVTEGAIHYQPPPPFSTHPPYPGLDPYQWQASHLNSGYARGPPAYSAPFQGHGLAQFTPNPYPTSYPPAFSALPPPDHTGNGVPNGIMISQPGFQPPFPTPQAPAPAPVPPLSSVSAIPPPPIPSDAVKRHMDTTGRPSIASLDDSLRPPDELLRSAVECYWDRCQFWAPFVQEATFEYALGGNSSVYSRPPRALMNALAAVGVREMQDSGTDGGILRAKWADWYAFQARRELEHFLGSSPNSDAPGLMSLLEACQVALLLVMHYVAAGEATDSTSLAWRAAPCFLRLCFVSGKESSAWIPREPGSEGWIADEMRVRALACFFLVDALFAYHAQRGTSIDWYRIGFRLPCHDRFFAARDCRSVWEQALLSCRGRGDTPMVIADLAGLTPDQRRRTIADLVLPAFHGSGSVIGLSVFASVLRLERIWLRSVCDDKRIDLYTLVAKLTPEILERGVVAGQDGISADEASYVFRAMILSDAIDDLHKVLPPYIGESLAKGDGRPLLAYAEQLFGDKRHGGAALLAVGSFYSAKMQCWIPESVGTTAELAIHPGWEPAFFYSPIFRCVLQGAGTLVKLLECHMAEDPELSNVHFGALLGILNAGSLSIAIWRAKGFVPSNVPGSTDEQLRWDVGVVQRYLQALGTRYKPYGKFFARWSLFSAIHFSSFSSKGCSLRISWGRR